MFYIFPVSLRIISGLNINTNLTSDSTLNTHAITQSIIMLDPWIPH